MEEFKSFDPKDPKYKNAEDLPIEERFRYRDVEGGFVKKSVIEEDASADAHVKYNVWQNQELGTDETTNSKEILHERALNIESRRKIFLTEIEGFIKKNKRIIGHFLDRKRDVGSKDFNVYFQYVSQVLDFFQRNHEFINDPVVAREAVTRAPLLLGLLNPKLRNDKEIVMAAVSVDGMMIQYASPKLQIDREIITAALGQNSKASKLIPEKGLDAFIDGS